MALSSRRPGMGWITTASVALATAGSLTSCGGRSCGTLCGSAGGYGATPPTTTSQLASASGEVRFGCSTYCESAGGIGGTGGTGQTAVTIASHGTITLDADGHVPVTVTCNLPVQCRGAIIVDLNSINGGNRGRSDLVVNAGATSTLGVPMPAPSVAYIRSHGPTTLEVTADSGQSPGTAHWDPSAAGGPWAGGVTPVDVKGVTVAP
jgi:hypothetical protein